MVRDDEIGRVVGEVAVGLHVVELEADGEVVLGERRHVGRCFEERGEGQLQAAGVGFADDLVEDGFLGGQKGTMARCGRGAYRAAESGPSMRVVPLS